MRTPLISDDESMILWRLEHMRIICIMIGLQKIIFKKMENYYLICVDWDQVFKSKSIHEPVLKPETLIGQFGEKFYGEKF